MTEHQQSRSWRARIPKPNPLLIYTASVSGVGIGLFAWSLTQIQPTLPDLLLFVALVIVAELTTSEVFAPQMAFSMSAAVVFASLVLHGTLAGVLVATVSGLMITLVDQWRHPRAARTPLVQRSSFNMAVHGLSALAAGVVYAALGGRISDISLLSALPPLILAAASFEIVNSALVVGAVAIQIRKPPFSIWKQNVSWAIPMNLLSMIVGGGGLALGYQIAGLLGVGVFFLPLALTIYAFQMYVRQTKNQMEELEQNIAERKQAEEQLKASLAEKEVLLQEIHHRVKNNLQVMSSLLYLQSTQATDQETHDMLMESRNRVRSMALVHEKLYQTADFSRINFAQYIRSLANYLFGAYGVNPDAIQIRSNVEDVFLSIDAAVPCGLIINELVSNALQHAYPAGRKGEIRIDLHGHEAGQYELIVADDGVGLPEDLDYRQSESLGLQLVNTLANQLEGTIEVDRNDGTAVKVVFTELQYKKMS
jgi:two-component sensor histidine kinase